jgi:hypothetical protein
MAQKRPSPLMLWLTIVAAPAALGFESLLRILLFPPEFEEFRDIVRPLLTPVAWLMVGVAALAVIVGMSLQRRLAAGRVAKLKPPVDGDAVFRTVFSVFLLTVAVPQIPAILSTFLFTFGASLYPVIASVSVSSIGVVAQALRMKGLADQLTPKTN